MNGSPYSPSSAPRQNSSLRNSIRDLLGRLRTPSSSSNSSKVRLTGSISNSTPTVVLQSPPVVSKNTELSKASVVLPPSNIFKENISKIEYTPPEVNVAYQSTSQLAFCLRLLSLVDSPNSSQDNLETVLPIEQRQWIDKMLKEPDEKERIRSLCERIVAAFMEERLKDSTMIAEVACLAPVLRIEDYRSLLSWVVKAVRDSPLLEIHLLEGLSIIIQGAPPECLEANDLVSILDILNTLFKNTFKSSTVHVYRLTTAIGQVLDAMVLAEVKGLDHASLHEPLLGYLKELCGHKDIFVRFQGISAFQALLYIQDSQSTAIKYLRLTAGVLKDISGIASSVKNFDAVGVFNGFKDFSQDLSDILNVITNVYEGASGMLKNGESLIDSIKVGLRLNHKQSWYPALKILQGLIRQGSLLEFKDLVYNESCRRSKEFQFGICLCLGRIAFDSSAWDPETCKEAVDFLAEIYNNDEAWGQHSAVKEWIISLLRALAQSPSAPISGYTASIIKDMESVSDQRQLKEYSLYDATSILALSHIQPATKLLDRIQGIPTAKSNIRYDPSESEVQKIKKFSYEGFNQTIYIPLQYTQENNHTVMESIQAFLSGKSQVMLIKSDPGRGKSTFCRILERHLWESYSEGGSVPLLINLPAIKNPEEDLVTKHLLSLDVVSEDMIPELKRTKTFILICDGYDQIPMGKNVLACNLFNQVNKWTVTKIIITCRSSHIFPGYQKLLIPNSKGEEWREVTIAPFSDAQIKSYVQAYVDLKQTAWTSWRYLYELNKYPEIYSLAEYPFLLMVALEALTETYDMEQIMVSKKPTTIQLYDVLIEQWLRRGRERSFAKSLSPQAKTILEEVDKEGFSQKAIHFLKRLVVEMYTNQPGNNKVQYLPIVDRKGWKEQFFGLGDLATFMREASPLVRDIQCNQFINSYVQEYFFSCAIFDPRDYKSNSETDCSDLDPQRLPALHLLRILDLAQHPSILEFLSGRVQQYTVFRNQLLDIAKMSSLASDKDQRSNIAAANAIHILGRAGVALSEDPGHPKLLDTDSRNDATFGDFTNITRGPAYILCCEFSPKGDVLAIGGENGLYVFNTSTWQKLWGLENHSVYKLSFHSSGRTLAAQVGKTQIQQLETATGKCSLTHVIKHDTKLIELQYSPVGPQVAYMSLNYGSRCRIWIWNTLSRSCNRFPVNHNIVYQDRVAGDEHFTSMSYSPDGNHLAILDGSNTVRIMSLETCTTVSAFPILPLDWPSKLRYFPHGQKIAVSYSNKIHVFDVQSGQILHTLEGRLEQINGFSISPICSQIAIYGKSRSTCDIVQLWDSQTGSIVHEIEKMTNSFSNLYVKDMSYSPDGHYIAVGMGLQDGRFELWDTNALSSKVSTGSGSSKENEGAGKYHS